MSEKAGLSVKKSEGKEKGPVTSSSKTDFSQSMEINSPVQQVLHLQRTIGNQAVTRLIQSGVLQAKLKIGQPGDIYEQEAERVAEQVMRMRTPDPSCPECSEEIKTSIQAKPLVGQISPLVQRQMSEVTPDIESRINAVKGGGQPLPESTRAFFEPRFGVDFNQVRVHTNSEAAQTAQAINARAFTIGKDIVFGAGQYSPGTSSGKLLLAHELAHVVQQNGGNASVSPSRSETAMPRLRAGLRLQRSDVCCPKTGFPQVTHTGTTANATTAFHSFDMVVEYKTDGTASGSDTCKVGNCEFRQVIKGYLKFGGVPQTLRSSGSGLVINATTYVDDGYTNADDTDSSRYRFETNDNPGAHGTLSAGDDIELYLNFEARVIDTGAGNAIRARKTGYWIKIAGKHPRTLTHGGF